MIAAKRSDIQAATHKAIGILLHSGAKTSTAYISDKLVVRVSRRTYLRRTRGVKPIELSVTIGRPNYHARKFITLAKRAGEPFPIKKAHLTFQRNK